MAELFGIGAFYGETRSLDIADVILSEVRHAQAVSMPSHTHEAGHFCLLLDGSYVEHSHSTTIRYAPLTVAFLPPGVPHADTVGEGGCRFFIAELRPRWMEVLESYGPLEMSLDELHGGDPTWLALRLYNEYRAPELTSELVIESLLYELCGHIPRMRSDDVAEPAWLRRTLSTIHEQFTAPLHLRELADEAGVHPTHLARAFRRVHGRPIGDYVTGLRIQYACRRLQDRDLALSAVAAECGFADQSHLTRVFKSITGVTPAAYRRRA